MVIIIYQVGFFCAGVQGKCGYKSLLSLNCVICDVSMMGYGLLKQN